MLNDTLETLAFIGGGNMARSLIGGLLAQGLDAAQIIVAEPLAEQRLRLAEQYSVAVTADNAAAVSTAQVVVLAVKPQELRNVALALASHLTPGALVISVAAGIRTLDLRTWLGVSVVRTMPNRPALNGCGVTGLFADEEVPAAQRTLAQRIMSAVGKTVWVTTESQLDAVTAISGSGPAYFFLLMELLEAAALELGLPEHTARTLAVETAYGAGMMAHEMSEAPALLRQQVTSKGGTTEAALQVFTAHDLKRIVALAVHAAAQRSAQLGSPQSAQQSGA